MTTDYDYDDNNKLRTATPQGGTVTTYNYDKDGNLTSKAVGTATPTYYTYDLENNLESVTPPNSGQVSHFTYNSDGQRIWKSDSTGSRKMLYASGALVEELDQTTGQVLIWYNPGVGEYDGAYRYYHQDLIGSTAALSNVSGSQTDRFIYDAWGNVYSHTGSADPRYKYVGKEGYYSDKDTGLMQLGARFYDPTVGRFVTMDPAQDGTNWYAYAGGNPLRNIDPTGCYYEMLLDIAGFGYDVYEFRKEPSFWGGVSIAGDILGIALPIIPSVGGAKLGYKGIKLAIGHGDDVGKAVKFGEQAIKLGPEAEKTIATAVRAGEKLEKHHLLPLQFEPYFSKAGLSVEDYTVGLPKDLHRLKPGGLHTGPDNWNKQWDMFRRQFENPSGKQVEQHLNWMMKRYGLR